MRKSIIIIALMALSRVFAADLYLDLNGSQPGFDVTTNNAPIEVDFTSAIWNTDPSGGDAGALTSVSEGDVLHFGMEGSGGILFNWTHFTNVAIGGIHVYNPEGSDATVKRFQKAGGGLENIRFTDGATFDTEQFCSLWFDLGTSGDFEKVGDKWLIFTDSKPRVNGTVTITEGNVIYQNLLAVGEEVASFVINGGQLRFQENISGTANLGTLSGDGKVDRNGTSGSLLNLTISTTGFAMTNDFAGDVLVFDRGPQVVLAEDAVSTFDIAKIGGTNHSDTVQTLWGQTDLTFAGDLNVATLPESEPLIAGDAFQLFAKHANAEFLGAFDNVNLPNLDAGLLWDESGLAVSGVVAVVEEDVSAPTAPTGLIAASNVYTVSLSWDAHPSPSVVSYTVYREETEDGAFADVFAETTDPHFLDTTTEANDSTYYYRVSAVNSADVSGEQSATASTTVPFGLRNGDFELPAIAANSSTSISNSGDWAQSGERQFIHNASWAPETGNQGVRLQAWNVNTTNAFWQDKEGTASVEYTLDAGIKFANNFVTNGCELTMALIWLDGSGAEIGREEIDAHVELAETTEWAHLTMTTNAPAGTAIVRAWFGWNTPPTNALANNIAAFIDNVTLTRSVTPDAYDVWSSAFGLVEGPEGDDDKDGLSNLAEYALGGDPTDPADQGLSPTLSAAEDGTPDVFDYVYPRRTDDANLAYFVEINPDLIHGSWTNEGIVQIGVGDEIDGFEAVTNRTSSVESRKYIRLTVERD